MISYILLNNEHKGTFLIAKGLKGFDELAIEYKMIYRVSS